MQLDYFSISFSPSVHVDDPAFLALLGKNLIDMGDYPVILGGDFIEVMDPVLDRSSGVVRISMAHVALFGGYKILLGGIILFSLLLIAPSRG